MTKKVLSIGAEAILILDKEKNVVIKERAPKSYRIKELDYKIRSFRTRREAKVLDKLKSLGFTPKVIFGDNEHTLELEYIVGTRLSEVLEQQNIDILSREIGKKIKQIHDTGIIHGDLTTSNMILKSGFSTSAYDGNGLSSVDNKLYFIDFGLSFFSEKTEDRAVDIHLLGQALESKHHTISKKMFGKIKQAYGDEAVLKRLESVEKRGRNKNH